MACQRLSAFELSYYWAGNLRGCPDSTKCISQPYYWAGRAGSMALPNMPLAVLTTGRVTSREPDRLTTGRDRMAAATTKGTGWLRVACHYRKCSSPEIHQFLTCYVYITKKKNRYRSRLDNPTIRGSPTSRPHWSASQRSRRLRVNDCLHYV